MEPTSRTQYLQRLKEDLDKKAAEKKIIPVTESNRSVIYRYTSDIEQLKWRVKYLESLGI